MILGDFYGQLETKQVEFKEFYLKITPNLILTNEEINYIICTGKLFKKINHIIFLNIKCYLSYYLPKYISCFINSKINGKLVIGVNDFGEITGIPFIGQIKKSKIENFISHLEINYLQGLTNLNKFISINFIKLDKDINIIDDDANEIIQDMNKRNKLFNSIKQDYIIKKKKWLDKMSLFNTKLIKIIENKDLRSELFEFISLKSNNNKVLELLKTSNTIPFDNVFYRVKNKQDIFYWVAKYKDFKINELKKIKPKKIQKPSLINETMILSNLSDMRYRFIKNNKNLNYYLLEISINCSECSQPIKFKSPLNNLWTFRKRINNKYGPSCV